MSSDLLISNPRKFENLKRLLQKAGPDSVHVLSDFDRTLIKAFVRGKKVASMISVLRNENHLTPDYPQKAEGLFRHYHQIEVDPNLPLAEKKAAMQEWWTRHFQLLIASGLTQADIEKVVSSPELQLRKGAGDFFGLLNEKNIPLIIMSSSGLGGGAIVKFLEKEKLNLPNVEVISNQLVWDAKGRLQSVKTPIIHALNKDETILKSFPIYEKIRSRKNVILLGDSPHDLEMVTGFDYASLLTIGFLNEQAEKNLGNYQRVFDLIITNDGALSGVNDFFQELF
ncbi:hypothetical protein C4546_02475 [Candidatus Parcubacteria bacterium]|jgi:5'-nucleotidase|nr:MAG: hypothetical protein C4546_02475 [Candidatus Parcubacteria bacterium]